MIDFQPDTEQKPTSRIDFQADAAPTYSSGISTQRKPGETLGGDLSDIAKKVTDFAGGTPLADFFGTALAKKVVRPEAQQYVHQDYTPAETAGSAALTGVSLLPIASLEKIGITAMGKMGLGSVASRVLAAHAAGGAVGYGVDVGSNLEQGKTGSEALKPGLGTAIGLGIPAAGAIAQGAKAAVAKNAPRLITNPLIKPLLRDFSYGKNPGRALAEEGIVANNWADLGKQTTLARQRVGSAIGSLDSSLSSRGVPPPRLSISNALKPVDDAMAEAARQGNQSVLVRLNTVKRSLTQNLRLGFDEAGSPQIQSNTSRILDNLTYGEARDFLGEVGDLTTFSGNPSDDKLINATLKKVYGNIKQATLNTLKDASPELRAKADKLFEKYSDLKSAEIAITHRDQIIQRQNMISLPNVVWGVGSGILTALATGGAAIPAILAAAAGVTLDKALSTPAVRTRVSAWLTSASREEIQQVLKAAPQLTAPIQRLFNFKFPGDYFLESKAGKATIDYTKRAQIGMSIKNVGKLSSAELGTLRDYSEHIHGTLKGFSDKEGLQLEEDAAYIIKKYGLSSSKDPRKVVQAVNAVLDSQLKPTLMGKTPNRDDLGRFTPSEKQFENIENNRPFTPSEQILKAFRRKKK